MSMLMLAIGGLVFGALLGQRFKVLVLLPASAFVTLAVSALTLARDNNALLTVLAVALVVTSLQIGYLAGAAGRLVGTLAKPARAGAALQGPAR
jgi:hypothetical protein